MVSIANTSKYYTLISKEIEDIHHKNVRRRLVNIDNDINVTTMSTSECIKMYYRYRIRSCVDGVIEQLYTWHRNDDYRAHSLDGIPEYEYLVDALATRLFNIKN